MTCPFHTDDEESSENQNERATGRGSGNRDSGGLDRRSFVKSALLIGGGSALAALTDATDLSPVTRAAADATGRPTAAARKNRQHAWDAFETEAATGNTAQPASSLVLMLDYRRDGPPTPDHRQQVERALRGLEEQFHWSAEGLLFTIAYSASYFDRFGADPPAGAAPWPAERVVDESSDITPYDPTPDTADAVLLLASDNPANTLAAEAALWGEDGDDVPDLGATFEGVFERPEQWPDRRVGEGGPEFQAKESEYERFLGDDVEEDIPDETPLSMGFIAGFGESIPQEEAVTLKRGQRFPGPDVDAADVPTDLSYVGEVGERDPGVFAQGAFKHLSYLTIDLDAWYGKSRERRRHQMYSPYHGADETTDNPEKPGSGLVDADGDAEADRPDGPGTETLVSRADAGTETDGDDLVYADKVPETAAEGTDETEGEPTLAHSQKSARARYDVDGDGEVEQPCLRRDWDGIRPPENGYTERAGYHFNVPMRFNESIFTLLDANYGPQFRSLDGRIDHSDVAAADETTGAGERNGLVPFMEATRRNNWLVPPITVRALPHPRADRATLSVNRDGDAYVVEASGVGRVVAGDSIRFGERERVHQAGGARPVDVWAEGGDLYVEVPADEVEAGAGDAVAFFATQRDTRKPILGTTTL